MNGDARAPLHPFAANPEVAPLERSMERELRARDSVKTRKLLDFVIVAGLLVAFIPQTIYYILFFTSGYELSPMSRDSLLLFAGSGNLTAIIIITATAYFARKLESRADSLDEIVDKAAQDVQLAKSRLLGVTFDFESFSQDWNKAIEVYHTHKAEFQLALKMLPQLVMLMPALERKYGARIKNFKDLSPEEQDCLVEEMFRRDDLVMRKYRKTPPGAGG